MLFTSCVRSEGQIAGCHPSPCRCYPIDAAVLRRRYRNRYRYSKPLHMWQKRNEDCLCVCMTVQGLSRHRRLRGVGTRPVACPCLAAVPAAWWLVTRLQRQQGLTPGLHPVSTSQGSLQSPRSADRDEILHLFPPPASEQHHSCIENLVSGQRSVTGHQPSIHVPCGSVQLPILKSVVAGLYMAVRLDDGARNQCITQACFALRHSRDERSTTPSRRPTLAGDNGA